MHLHLSGTAGQVGGGVGNAAKPRSQPDPRLLGNERQVGWPADGGRATAAEHCRAGAPALVTGVADAADDPPEQQRTGHPQRHPRQCGHVIEGALVGRGMNVQRLHRAVAVALPVA